MWNSDCYHYTFDLQLWNKNSVVFGHPISWTQQTEKKRHRLKTSQLLHQTIRKISNTYWQQKSGPASCTWTSSACWVRPGFWLSWGSRISYVSWRWSGLRWTQQERQRRSWCTPSSRCPWLECTRIWGEGKRTLHRFTFIPKWNFTCDLYNPNPNGLIIIIIAGCLPGPGPPSSSKRLCPS